ncbi:MAG: hypothetical protein HOP19_00555, partial [Acidobacteria bacterium]|nr:hypothetical protein [Acidobacteriota bacterium]
MRQQFRAGGRRVVTYVLCSFLLSLQFILTSFAQGNRPEQAAWGTRGQTALNRLGNRLPEV